MGDKKQEKTKEKEVSTPELEIKLEKLQAELDDKNAEISKLEADVKDWKSKATSYLNTASYYKAQAEDNKKDFDRYKERNKNIEADSVLKANQIVAKKILPTLDNFNHAMQAVSPEVMQGFIMIYTSLMDTIKDLGVTEIICNGEKLDPEKHNCIETIETQDENLDGTIAKVYQKGYWFADFNIVVRPANVSVYKLV